MTSTVEAASLNNARMLRFEAFATIVTFGVMELLPFRSNLLRQLCCRRRK